MSAYILQTAATVAASPVVYVKQYDRGYTLDFIIYDGEEPIDLTGCSVLVNLTKPDQHVYIGIGEISFTIAGGVSVRLDQARQMTAAAGEGVLELAVIKGGVTKATANARYVVLESPETYAVVSGSVVTSIIAIAEEIASSVTGAETAAANAAAAASLAGEYRDAAEEYKDEAASIAIGNIRDAIFPVGSIVQYTSASVDPNNLIGGTWERIQGRFLFAADNDHAIGTTGGSETQTLTVENLPAHRHYTVNLGVSDGNAPTYQKTLARYDRSATSWEDCHYQLMGNNNDANGGKTSATGSGTAHNNMPPYLAVYIWKRTA